MGVSDAGGRFSAKNVHPFLGVNLQFALSLQKFGLQLKATLEHISKLRPDGEDFRWFLKVKRLRKSVGETQPDPSDWDTVCV